MNLKENRNYNTVEMLANEKKNLKKMVYEKFDLIKSEEKTEIIKDALFVIDKCFEDLMADCSKYTTEGIERKINIFKESLIASICEF